MAFLARDLFGVTDPAICKTCQRAKQKLVTKYAFEVTTFLHYNLYSYHLQFIGNLVKFELASLSIYFEIISIRVVLEYAFIMKVQIL